MMPEGFHQLLRRSFVVDISLFSVVFLLQLFFLLHIQAFETSAALEVFSVNFNASVPEVFSPDGEISKVIVFPKKGNKKKRIDHKTLKVVFPDEGKRG